MHLYVVDSRNNTIRKIAIASPHTVSTLAGDATQPAGLTDLTGSAARFDRPDGIWGDDAGNLYVTERDNGTVRKVTYPEAEVETFAGGGCCFADGVGTAAEFDTPSGIWGDGTFLYVSDNEDHIIRRIHIATAFVDTLAGNVNSSGGFIDGTGALIPTPPETAIAGTNSIPNAFSYQLFGPDVPVAAETVSITVTGTPTLTTVSPNSGAADSAVSVTLTGTGFVPGDTDVSVFGSDIAVSGVDVSGNTLTATFTIASGATQDARDVTVTTAAGTSSPPKTFTVLAPVPTITGISPDSGKQGATVPVTITGTHFTGTSVDISGTGALVSGFTVDSATQITAALILSGAPGTRTITVTTSGAPSNTFDFTIDSSEITSETGDFEATTLAGNQGFGSGDTGTGSAAAFNTPHGSWSDGTNLFVSDSVNHTIRKIEISSGDVTTLAGKAGESGSANDASGGTDARFNGPAGIVGDGSGNLYVADFNNNTIRNIVLSGGVATSVSTLAGDASQAAGNVNDTGSAARFNGPFGISCCAADPAALYVTDSGSHTIREVIISTGAVTTPVGTVNDPGLVNASDNAAKFNTPKGLWAAGGVLYMVDSANNVIRKVTTVGEHVVTTFASGFNDPVGIFGDGSTNLFVGDRGTDTIKKIIISSQAVSTFAGSSGSSGFVEGNASTVRFNNPGFVSIASGNLYVSDEQNHAIRSTSLASVSFSTLAGSPNPKSGTTDETGSKARFNFPGGTWGDGTNLYISDTSNHTIRKIVLSTGAVTTLAGSAGVSGSTDSPAKFSSPEGLWGDGLGKLYVADTGNHLIRSIDLSTNPVTVTTLAGTGSPGQADLSGTSASFDGPHALWGDSATLYVADKNNHVIRKIVISGAAVTTFAGVTDDAAFLDDPTGTSAKFNTPLGIWGDDTNLYVADGLNERIRKIVIGGTQTVTTIAGSGASGTGDNDPGTSAQFHSPHAVWGDGTFLYVVEVNGDTIRRVAIASPHAVTTPVGSADNEGFVNGTGSAARFNFPQTIWGDGLNLYVSDGDNHQIRKLADTP